MTFRSLLLGFAGVLIGACSAHATVLQSFTAGTASDISFFGQSVTTPLGGPFNNIKFNFYTGPTAATPIALGTLYILTSAYTGTPTALSSSTPGFLASSLGNTGGTLYFFDASVVLNSATQYFFYEKTNENTDFAGGGGYIGGDAFRAPTASSSFVEVPVQDVDFTLQGTFVPEPFTLSVFGVGVAGIAAMRRRKKNAAK